MCTPDPLALDIRGMGALLCNHGVVHAALNIPVGEKWAYAIVLLCVLLQHNTFAHTFYYDINCRWAPVFQEWVRHVATTGLLPEWLCECLGLMRCPLPPFHIKMQKPASQVMNGADKYPDVTLASGELTETFWSGFSKVASTTKYMAKHHRDQQHINLILDHIEGKDARMGPHLKARITNAAKLQEQAKDAAMLASDFLDCQACFGALAPLLRLIVRRAW